MKKILLIVIDALASDVLKRALEQGRLPNLQKLAEAGKLELNCTATFPSITPAATASIATGCYPREHGILGAYFYDTAEDRVHYYGADFWVIINRGMGDFFKNFLVQLNEKRLRCDTVFQQVERASLSAACLDYLIFRGDVPHKVNVPLLLKLLPGVPYSAEVHGPQILSLGDFVTTRLKRSGENLSAPGGIIHRYGFDDECAARHLIQLARDGPLPDFTLAYFPDNDYSSHDRGPFDAEPTIETFDRKLGELVGIWGDAERMLREVTILVTGDHSQCDIVRDDNKASIDLNRVLGRYSLVEAGTPWEDDEQMMVCPNLRAAQIYLRPNLVPRLERIVETILSDPRVDQVMWKENTETGRPPVYHVATADRGRLRFWPDGNDGTDDYNNRWDWNGKLDAVGGEITRTDRLCFEEYPNAFERIATSFDERMSGDLWVTARVGHEFRIPGTAIHGGGGSHGALHRLDSTVPLLIAGAGDDLPLPEHPRTVDITPICLSLLGVKPQRAPGAGHVLG